MRHLLILPGNSARNKAWGEAMLAHYRDDFDSTCLHLYEHWERDGGNINFLLEEVRLKEHLDTLPPETAVTVLAKSAGSILTFMAVESGVLKPVQCYFFGIPLDWAVADVWAGNWSAVDSFKVSATAFHNDKDPVADYSYTRDMLKEHAPHVKLITTPDPDHVYDRTDIYDGYIKLKP